MILVYFLGTLIIYRKFTMFPTNYFHWIEIVLLYPLMVVCPRYDFLLFENFEATKSIFVNEQSMVRKLETVRVKLHKKRVKLCNLTKSATEQWVAPLQNIKTLKLSFDFTIDMILKFRRDNDSLSLLNIIVSRHCVLFGYKYNNSGQQIMAGAQKGVLISQETYEQNIKEFSKGHLDLHGSIGNNSRPMDSLQPDDLACMSIMAFDLYKWYDTSLKFLKQSLDSLETLSNVQLKKFPESLEQILLRMKYLLPVYHNEMLGKKQSYIGSDWKLFPYIVDKGVLCYETAQI